jgi:hypothetical protein
LKGFVGLPKTAHVSAAFTGNAKDAGEEGRVRPTEVLELAAAVAAPTLPRVSRGVRERRQ